MSDAAIHVHNLGKQFRVWAHARPTNMKERLAFMTASMRHRRQVAGVPLVQEIWAIRGASFDVKRGEVLGLIGPNGAGKSTLLSLLARITEPTEGYAELRGRVSSLLEVGTGFHPELSGRDNIYLNGAVLGMPRREIAAKYDEIVEFSGVGEFLDIPIKRYSTGMHVRLAFAVAAHLDPEILLLDEVLAVGDQAFQQKCLARISEMTQSGRTVLFVSHDVASVARLCRSALLVQDGRIVFQGTSEQAIERYLGSRPRHVGGGHLGAATRSGSGALRFTSVQIIGAEGGSTVVADKPVEFRLEFAGPRPMPAKHLQVTLTVASPSSGALATLSTRFDPSSDVRTGEIGHGTTMICRVDELPLRPGRYFLSLSVDRAGEILDRVMDQVEFTVVPSDFHGGGVPAGETDAPLLLRHRWAVEASATSQATAS